MQSVFTAIDHKANSEAQIAGHASEIHAYNFVFKKTVVYANEANRITHSAENLYKLVTRLELSSR